MSSHNKRSILNVLPCPVFDSVKTRSFLEKVKYALSIPRFSDLYYLCLMALSVLGLFTHGYTFGFHLLHIVMGNDLLLRVLQSVTKNGKALLMVGMLGLIIVYLYTLMVFAFYRPSIALDNTLFCGSVWECFMTVLSHGLRAGGGIGDALPYSDSTWWPYNNMRDFFDLSFFLIVIIVGLNIVFGIIVDTFSELRDEKSRIEEDNQTVCFICSLPG